MSFSHKPQLLMHRDRLQQPCPWPASSKHAEKAAPPAANRRGSRLVHAGNRPEQHHSTPSQKGGQSGTGINSFIHHPTRHLSAEQILQESHYVRHARLQTQKRPTSSFHHSIIHHSITPSLSSPSRPTLYLHPTPCVHAARTDVSPSSLFPMHRVKGVTCTYSSPSPVPSATEYILGILKMPKQQ